MQNKVLQINKERADAFFRRTGEYLFDEYIPLEAEFCRSREPVPYRDRQNGKFLPAKEGTRWGEAWDSAWFHISGKVPEEWCGKAVALHLNFSSEALIFDEHGVPLYGLSVSSIFDEQFRKEIFQLIDNAAGGEKIDYWIETAANQLFGQYMDEDPSLRCTYPYGKIDPVVKYLRYGVFNKEIWRLRLDLEILFGLCDSLPEEDYRRKRIIGAINKAIDIYGDNSANAAQARLPLQEILSLPASASAMRVTAIGHAHIDTGWLWPVRETIRKCARTFANQIYNIEKYPDYIFGASQPQHYLFVKKYYPELYKKIKKAVKAGRWELQGGMWVEADCNLISGESMIRQFLHGKNFFMDEFGVEVTNLWLPDVFGYSAAMPQIIKKSGCDFFLTQKISFNQFNKFPYNTFMWKGIDGTEILTHFPPENSYLAELNPAQLIPAQNRFSENVIADEFVSLFGIGDGGGGPKEEYIERGQRLANLEGSPRVEFGKASDAFDRMKKLTPQLPKWSGELYLEFHRGTFTSQARVKRGNRKLEQALTETEMLFSALPLSEYPAAALDKLWKVLLINQFHDILPGSSIGMVYEVTEREYAEAMEQCRLLNSQAAEKLFVQDNDALTVFNSLSYDYRAPVKMPSEWVAHEILDENGCKLPVQQENGHSTVALQIPANSFVTLRKGEKNSRNSSCETSSLVLENDFIRYEFSPNGELISAYDKECAREVIDSGNRGNVFKLYIDQPNHYEAWDIDFHYEQQFVGNPTPVRECRGCNGKVYQQLKFELRISNSFIRQSVSLAKDTKRLDFDTWVDWHENRKMLRVAFDLALSSQTAGFDIQYGFVERNTHSNTSWDFAKFEVPAQRYADISTFDYGAALINDCKYGYKVRQSTIDMCLLRSPKYPDWNADQGEHIFAYAFLPHKGRFPDSPVIQEAYCFNRPPLLFPGFASEDAALPCHLESQGINLEVIKKAEKEACLVIRLVESLGRSSSGILRLRKPWNKIRETNLIEWEDGKPLKLEDHELALTLKPFEIKTLKLSAD